MARYDFENRWRGTSLNIALAVGGSDRCFAVGFVSGKCSFVFLKNPFNAKDAGTMPASFAKKWLIKNTKLDFFDMNVTAKSHISDSVLFTRRNKKNRKLS